MTIQENLILDISAIYEGYFISPKLLITCCSSFTNLDVLFGNTYALSIFNLSNYIISHH